MQIRSNQVPAVSKRFLSKRFSSCQCFFQRRVYTSRTLLTQREAFFIAFMHTTITGSHQEGRGVPMRTVFSIPGAPRGDATGDFFFNTPDGNQWFTYILDGRGSQGSRHGWALQDFRYVNHKIIFLACRSVDNLESNETLSTFPSKFSIDSIEYGQR